MKVKDIIPQAPELKPIFSGDSSIKLWEKISEANSIPKLRMALFSLACKVQELEGRVFSDTDHEELGRNKPGPKPSGKAMTNAERQAKWRADHLVLARKRQKISMRKLRDRKKASSATSIVQQ